MHALAFHNCASYFIPSAHVDPIPSAHGLLPHPGRRLLHTKDSTVAATVAPIAKTISKILFSITGGLSLTL